MNWCWWAGVVELLKMSWCCWTLADDWCCSTYIDEFGLRHSRHTWSWGYQTVDGKVLMSDRADEMSFMSGWYTLVPELMVMSWVFWNGDDGMMLLNCGDELMPLNFSWRYDTNELMSRDGVGELIFLKQFIAMTNCQLRLMNWYFWTAGDYSVLPKLCWISVLLNCYCSADVSELL